MENRRQAVTEIDQRVPSLLEQFRRRQQRLSGAPGPGGGPVQPSAVQPGAATQWLRRGNFFDFTLGGIYFYQKTFYASVRTIRSCPTARRRADVRFHAERSDHDQDHAALRTRCGISPGVGLNAGIRYTKEDKSSTFERLNIDGVTPYLPLSNPANPLNGKEGVFDGAHVDYRVDLDYQWTPSLMSYVEWSTGFKGGGITPRPYFPSR